MKRAARRAALALANPLDDLDPSFVCYQCDLADGGRTAILEAARALGVLPAVAYQLDRAGIALEPGVTQYLEWIFVRHQLLMEAAGDALQAVEALSIPVMPIKGAAIALQEYASVPGTRFMLDVDLLVDEGRFTDIGGAMVQAGFVRRLAKPISDRLNVEATFERPLFPSGDRQELAIVEIHRRLCSPGRHRVNHRGIWRRSTPASGAPGRRMEVHDNLIYLAIHKAQSGYRNAATDLLDAANLLRRREVNGDCLVERAREHGAATVTWVFLSYLVELVRAPIPESVLAELAPASAQRKLILRRLFGDILSPRHTLAANDARNLSTKVAQTVLASDTPGRETAAIALLALRGPLDRAVGASRLLRQLAHHLDRIPM